MAFFVKKFGFVIGFLTNIFLWTPLYSTDDVRRREEFSTIEKSSKGNIEEAELIDFSKQGGSNGYDTSILLAESKFLYNSYLINNEKFIDYPQKATLLIKVYFSGSPKLEGTAFMIHPHFALTAAYNMINPDITGCGGNVLISTKYNFFFPSEIHCLSSSGLVESPNSASSVVKEKYFKRASVHSFALPSNEENDIFENVNDYALLYFDRPIGNNVGYFMWEKEPEKRFGELEILLGYGLGNGIMSSANVKNSLSISLKFQQKASNDKSSRIEKGILYHSIREAQGMTGSPLLFKNEEGYGFYAIHLDNWLRSDEEEEKAPLESKAALIDSSAIEKLNVFANYIWNKRNSASFKVNSFDNIFNKKETHIGYSFTFPMNNQ